MKPRGRAPGAPHKFPWTPSSLDSLKRLAEQNPAMTLRTMGDKISDAYALPVPDPATVRRALARLGVRS